MSLLAVLDPAVSLAHTLLIQCQAALDPVLGTASVAVSLVLITLAVRLCLVPLSIRIARADAARRALAPQLDRLRRRHSADPARLVRELQQAHREAGISPLAGLLPGLAQGPFLMVVYRLCTLAAIADVPNLVLTASLFGAPLAQHGLAIVTTAGLVSAPALVFALVITAMLAVAAWSSSVALARVRGASNGDTPGVQVLMARVLPFTTVRGSRARWPTGRSRPATAPGAAARPPGRAAG